MCGGSLVQSILLPMRGWSPESNRAVVKVRHGKTSEDVNRYLKWAYGEAANVVACYHRKHPHRHVSQLYARILQRRGHQKAVGAVGRHLAEATYCGEALSGAGLQKPGRGDGGVNAGETHEHKSSAIDCGTSPENLMPKMDEEMYPVLMVRG